MKKTNYILNTITLLKLILKNNYTSNWNKDILLLKEVTSLNYKTKQDLILYINSLKIPKLNILLENKNLSDLNFKEILNLFSKILSTIKVSYYQDLMLLKYHSHNIYLTGWHNLAIQCRGKVINKNTLDIISYPFDKFFNLYENEDLSKEKILDLISTANSIRVTEKIDGSTISITKYKNNLIITTNGSFTAEQVKVAKTIIKNTYTNLEENIKENFTYIFEIIYPQNQIVVNYGDERALYLLAIRNNSTTRFLQQDDLLKISKQLGTPLTPTYKFTSLEDFLVKQLDNSYNKEGWVFYITLDNQDILFKLKYINYFNSHRLVANMSLKTIYNLFISSNNIDDIKANIKNDNFKLYISELEDISVYLNNLVKNEVQEIQRTLVNQDPNSNFKDILSLIKTDSLKPFIIKSLKINNPSNFLSIHDLSYKKFINIITQLDDDFINNKSIINLLNKE